MFNCASIRRTIYGTVRVRGSNAYWERGPSSQIRVFHQHPLLSHAAPAHRKWKGSVSGFRSRRSPSWTNGTATFPYISGSVRILSACSREGGCRLPGSFSKCLRPSLCFSAVQSHRTHLTCVDRPCAYRPFLRGPPSPLDPESGLESRLCSAWRKQGEHEQG